MIPGSKIQPKGAPPGVSGESRIGTKRVEADATILLQYDLTSIRSYFNTILLQQMLLQQLSLQFAAKECQTGGGIVVERSGSFN